MRTNFEKQRGGGKNVVHAFGDTVKTGKTTEDYRATAAIGAIEGSKMLL